MNPVSRRFLIAALVAAPAGVSPAVAQVVLFDTINAANARSISLPAVGDWVAGSFSTDASSTSIVDVQVVAKMGTQPTGTFSVSLWSDSSLKPGIKLYDVGSKADSSLSAAPSTQDFSGLSLAVNPSTRYWIVLSDSVASGSAVGYIGLRAVAISGEKLATTSSGGSSWNVLPFTTGQMSVTAVPEPATEAAVVAGALVSFGAYRLRRKRA